MAEMGRWNGHIFEVSPSVIRSWSGLTIKGSNKTSDKTKKKEKYIATSTTNPTEIGLTIYLYAQLGCDVRAETMAFVEEARKGATDYFYVGDTKLVPYSLLLTEANVKESKFGSNGEWISAQIKLTMKQGETMPVEKTSNKKNKKTTAPSIYGTYDYSDSDGSSGSKKKSVKSSGTTTTKTTTKATVTAKVDVKVNTDVAKKPVSVAEATKKQSVSSAQTAINKITSSAKAQSSKVTSAAKTVVKNNVLKSK